jgi:hypothetical protein
MLIRVSFRDSFPDIDLLGELYAIECAPFVRPDGFRHVPKVFTHHGLGAETGRDIPQIPVPVYAHKVALPIAMHCGPDNSNFDFVLVHFVILLACHEFRHSATRDYDDD